MFQVVKCCKFKDKVFRKRYPWNECVHTRTFAFPHTMILHVKQKCGRRMVLERCSAAQVFIVYFQSRCCPWWLSAVFKLHLLQLG